MLKAALAEMDQKMEEIKPMTEVSDDSSKGNNDREEEKQGVAVSQDERSDKWTCHEHSGEWKNENDDGSSVQTSKESGKDSEGHESKYYAEEYESGDQSVLGDGTIGMERNM